LFKILIDTCVWLDLAKDYQQQPILTALEELIRMGDIELTLPRTVLDEFARNKGRVVEESSRSLSGTMKRVKEAVDGKLSALRWVLGDEWDMLDT
jgi:predicted nucleic acid-binding protein